MIAKLVALLVMLGVIAWQSSQIHKWHTKADGLAAELQAITDARNTQKTVTRDRIKTVTKIVHDADRVARRIETAKSPGNCKTPQEILDADI